MKIKYFIIDRENDGSGDSTGYGFKDGYGTGYDLFLAVTFGKLSGSGNASGRGTRFKDGRGDNNSYFTDGGGDGWGFGSGAGNGNGGGAASGEPESYSC